MIYICTSEICIDEVEEEEEGEERRMVMLMLCYVQMMFSGSRHIGSWRTIHIDDFNLAAKLIKSKVYPINSETCKVLAIKVS